MIHFLDSVKILLVITLGKKLNEIIPPVIVQSSRKQWIDDSLASLNSILKNKRLKKKKKNSR